MCKFTHLTEPRAGRQEGDEGITPGEYKDQRWIEDQGPGGCAPVEGKVQETAEGAGGGEGPGSVPYRQGFAGRFRQMHSLNRFWHHSLQLQLRLSNSWSLWCWLSLRSEEISATGWDRWTDLPFSALLQHIASGRSGIIKLHLKWEKLSHPICFKGTTDRFYPWRSACPSQGVLLSLWRQL